MGFPIIFNTIIVNGQSSGGAVSIGENQQNGWSAHSKQNTSVGFLFGLNYTLNSLNYIIDNDYIDAPINDNDMPNSAQGQAL